MLKFEIYHDLVLRPFNDITIQIQSATNARIGSFIDIPTAFVYNTKMYKVRTIKVENTQVTYYVNNPWGCKMHRLKECNLALPDGHYIMLEGIFQAIRKHEKTVFSVVSSKYLYYCGNARRAEKEVKRWSNSKIETIELESIYEKYVLTNQQSK